MKGGRSCIRGGRNRNTHAGCDRLYGSPGDNQQISGGTFANICNDKNSMGCGEWVLDGEWHSDDLFNGGRVIVDR